MKTASPITQKVINMNIQELKTITLKHCSETITRFGQQVVTGGHQFDHNIGTINVVVESVASKKMLATPRFNFYLNGKRIAANKLQVLLLKHDNGL